MKLEKREITLNEADSIKSVFYFEKLLLSEYIDCLCKVERKESREVLLRMMCEVGEDMLFACDLMNGSAIKNGEK